MTILSSSTVTRGKRLNSRTSNGQPTQSGMSSEVQQQKYMVVFTSYYRDYYEIQCLARQIEQQAQSSRVLQERSLSFSESEVRLPRRFHLFRAFQGEGSFSFYCSLGFPWLANFYILFYWRRSFNIFYFRISKCLLFYQLGNTDLFNYVFWFLCHQALLSIISLPTASQRRKSDDLPRWPIRFLITLLKATLSQHFHN